MNIEKIIEIGKKVEVRGNKPLRLDNKDLCWFVTSGKVDIFSVKIKDSEPYGSKTHVTRFEAGEMFFGIEPDEIMFEALGTPETECIELTVSRLFENVTKDNIAKFCDIWVDKVSKSFIRKLRPKATDDLEIGKEMRLGKNKNFSPKHLEVTWIEFIDGQIEFINEIPIEEKYFPVSKSAWINVVDDSIINVFKTVEIVDKSNFLEYFYKFNKIILKKTKENILKTKDYEAKRLAAKNKHKSKILQASLYKIRSVLLPKKDKIVLDDFSGTELLRTCKIIGNYLKIKIIPHPEDNSNLENIMRASKIKSRKVILKENWWKYDSGPLLCFFEDNKKPVPVIPVSPRKYEIIDVENNKKIEVDEKIANKLQPFAYTFYRPFPEDDLTGWKILKFGLFNCGVDITMVVIMGVFGALLGLLTPIFTGIIFNTVIPEAATGQLFQLSFILISCAIATLLFEITKATAILRVEGKADYALQAAIWDRLMSLPVPFFRNYTAGDLAMRSMGIDGIRQILSGVTIQSILSCIFALFYWGLLFYYNVWLAVIGTILGVVLIASTFSIGYFLIKYQQEVNNIQNKLSGVILQFLSGVPKLRITGTEINAFSIWSKDFARKKEVSKKLGLTQGVFKSFMSMFPILSSICIFSYVTFKVGNGLTTGDFLAFNSAYSSFQNGLLQMGMALVSSLNVIPLYNNLKPILQTKPEVSEAKEHPGELTGNVEVSHLDFRYSNDGPLILKDVSIKINPDEFVAIVGGSGSGKSTLFRLLLGFEHPEKGGIFYDGKDLKSLDITEVRKQLGVVLQNAKLLQGSIFENIVGSSNLTIEDAWDAAKMSGCYEDIQDMPMKMHTVVPPGGGNLSGGQRQRIIIARALVKRPRLIYFDEATSALDNKTQAIVSESLENMKVTRVVIAHRLSTVRNADKIYYLEKGVIVESGTYDELMAKKGFFYELARRQLTES